VPSKAKKPARVARGTGFGNVSCWAASDFPKNSQSASTFQAQAAARRAVDEMVANGARFTITRRDGGEASFIYELPAGGNRSRCRRIIAEAKAASAGYWRAFMRAIVEVVEGGR
jgi:hypothetical protein